MNIVSVVLVLQIPDAIFFLCECSFRLVILTGFAFSSLPAAIIEHVRDGSVVRALLLPDHYLVTVMLSGVKVIAACSLARCLYRCAGV